MTEDQLEQEALGWLVDEGYPTDRSDSMRAHGLGALISYSLCIGRSPC